MRAVSTSIPVCLPSISSIISKASLEGSAPRSMQGLLLAVFNYTAAIDILKKKRLGKPQKVIVGHMDDLMIELHIHVWDLC